MAPASEYDAVPRPTRINLKETTAEKAEKLYRKEQRRARREAERIARANADRYDGANGAHGGRRAEPPPEPEIVVLSDDSDSDAGGPSNAARQHSRQTRDVPHDDDDPFNGPLPPFDDAFGAFTAFGRPDFTSFLRGAGPVPQHVPRRFARPRPPPPHHPGHGPQGMPHITDFVRFAGGPAPPMGAMSADAYAEWVRKGLHARRARDERAQADAWASARAAERDAAARNERIEEERAEREARRRRREERERYERRAAQDAAREAQNARAAHAEAVATQTAERARWRKRCAALFDAEVVPVNLAFADIPWPVSTARATDVNIVVSPADLTLDNVRAFLFALADDERGTRSREDARKRVLRDAIRLFHPDRFYARILPRVRDADCEVVKEGVEICSRLINALLSGA